MSPLHCDVAVIGAGTSGMAAERTARRAGARTLLIDAGFSGTTCASIGCISSKLLIAAADAAQAVRQASRFGVRATLDEIDGVAVMARVRQERDAFVAGVDDDYASLPDGVRIDATARFTGPTSLSLSNGQQVIDLFEGAPVASGRIVEFARQRRALRRRRMSTFLNAFLVRHRLLPRGANTNSTGGRFKRRGVGVNAIFVTDAVEFAAKNSGSRLKARRGEDRTAFAVLNQDRASVCRVARRWELEGADGGARRPGGAVRRTDVRRAARRETGSTAHRLLPGAERERRRDRARGGRQPL